MIEQFSRKAEGNGIYLQWLRSTSRKNQVDVQSRFKDINITCSPRLAFPRRVRNVGYTAKKCPAHCPESRLGGWWANRENVDECSANDPISNFRR